jgi:SAM-dependent methyltransferase
MLNEWIWMLKYNLCQLYRDVVSFRKSISEWRLFWKSYCQYKQIAPLSILPSLEYLYPCLSDSTTETIIEPIYFYQDAWAFEKIVQQHPVSHIDVGSHHKFVALLSKVVPVTMVDIRPLSLPLNSLKFLEGSILDLPFEDESIQSLSSLCVVEHIGLGRYGDPLDPMGSEKAIAELKRCIAPGGNLYLSLPIDDENRVYFNAHRAFTEEYLMKLFEPFIVEEKHYIFSQRFTPEREAGFGTGCYHLRNIKKTQ